MAYFSIGLAITALISFLISLKIIKPFQPELIKQIGIQRLKYFGRGLFIVPVLIIIIVVLLYYFVWQSSPLMRLAHMIWVLGLWMLGTSGLFIFVLSAQTKITYPYLALVAAFISISTAIYFTPLPNFGYVFSHPPGLILPAAIGALNISLSWVVTFQIGVISSKKTGENQ